MSAPLPPSHGTMLPLPDGDRDGETYDHGKDFDRLNAQQRRVYRALHSGAWRTLAEISALTRDPQASISARLRDLRKLRFGGFTVERRRRAGMPGTWEYRLASALGEPPVVQARPTRNQLLAEVAEWQQSSANWQALYQAECDRRVAQHRRLTAVLALCDHADLVSPNANLAAADVRKAAQGD